jgi:transposase
MAYSLDLRQRVVTATNQGMSIRQAASVFLVSTATIERWRRRARETGDLRPAPIPGRPRLIGETDLPRFDAQLTAYPDATLAEHCRRWQEQTGVQLSVSAMFHTINRRQWTLKKNVLSPVNATLTNDISGGRS